MLLACDNKFGWQWICVAPRLSLTFIKLVNRSIVGVLSAKDKVSVNWGENRSPWNRWDSSGTWYPEGFSPAALLGYISPDFPYSNFLFPHFTVGKWPSCSVGEEQLPFSVCCLMLAPRHWVWCLKLGQSVWDALWRNGRTGPSLPEQCFSHCTRRILTLKLR